MLDEFKKFAMRGNERARFMARQPGFISISLLTSRTPEGVRRK
jgi:hypothetical protein